MVSNAEQRKIRLKNDYQTMLNIRRPWLQWTIAAGSEPYVEAYELDLSLRTIVGNGPDYTHRHRILVSLPASYPHKVAPQVSYQGNPKPYHPNWYTDGRWCFGTWQVYESLGQHVVRMIQTLQYDLQITNEHSPANSEANRWFLANRSSGLFPCDATEMPDPTSGRVKLKTSTTKKTFRITG